MNKVKIARKAGVVLIAAIVAVAAISFGTTAANAQGGAGKGNGNGAHSAGIQVAKALFGAVEQVTGLTQQQLTTELDGTKTLTDIVTEHNADPVAVQATAKTTLIGDINAAVTAGKITQAQADKLTARLDPLLSALMNRKFDLNHHADKIQRLLHGAAVNALVQQTAQATKLSARQIVQDLTGGQTLAQIAQANNADVTTIISATTTDLTDRINKLVKAGKLKQDQATALINALPTTLAQIMNEVNPLQGTGRKQPGANPSSPATPNPSATAQPTAEPTTAPTDSSAPSLNAA